MAEEKVYKIAIARPAKNRYQESVLPYLFEYFSFERAIEINEKILNTTGTLSKNPGRGRKEKYLEEAKEEFRFILYKETKHFEIKIIYYISEGENTVYVTDFFLTKMDPQKITKKNNLGYKPVQITHLKDQLGNTRLTFGEEKTTQYLLTMEIDPLENRIIEAEDFENVFKSEDNKLPDLNQMPINASSEFLVTKGYVDEGLLVGLENIAIGGNDYCGVPKPTSTLFWLSLSVDCIHSQAWV